MDSAPDDRTYCSEGVPKNPAASPSRRVAARPGLGKTVRRVNSGPAA